MATFDLKEAVNISAMAVEKNVDEFLEAGVTKAKSIDASASRVAESPCHFECKYLSTHRLLGNGSVGCVDIVYGEVIRIHVDDNFILPSGKLDIPKIKPIARMEYYDYAVIEETFEMRIPGASGVAEDGLGGKS